MNPYRIVEITTDADDRTYALFYNGSRYVAGALDTRSSDLYAGASSSELYAPINGVVRFDLSGYIMQAPTGATHRERLDAVLPELRRRLYGVES